MSYNKFGQFNWYTTFLATTAFLLAAQPLGASYVDDRAEALQSLDQYKLCIRETWQIEGAKQIKETVLMFATYRAHAFANDLVTEALGAWLRHRAPCNKEQAAFANATLRYYGQQFSSRELLNNLDKERQDIIDTQNGRLARELAASPATRFGY